MFDEPRVLDSLLDTNVDPPDEAPFDGLDGAPGAREAMTRVVALGGSAGGIPALQRFFAAMPPSSGMAFVVILHLSPEHHSSLPEVIQKATGMNVEKAVDGRRVVPNHVYVIPPAKHLSLTDGHLRLMALPAERGQRMTVDLFFRSLAETHGTRSVAIVLSGADGDGALGIKSIKERGGLTIAQDPHEAGHPSMPRSAIATGMVDWVLEVGEMPARLLAFQAREQQLQMPSEQGPSPAALPLPVPTSDETALRAILVYLRTRTGRDFSYYKRATIVRRIARRIQVTEVDDLQTYLRNLHEHPAEAGALLQDLLISVTNFFRDKSAFAALEAHIPELFRNKKEGDTVRVWVPACATGEEAYSIAILLSEHARTLESPPAIQIFATDLDEEVLVAARKGAYPTSIAVDVSPGRLKAFFVQDHRGYRVRRELRELLLFAVHDLLKDPPFSRLDMVSCRNLLIYLNRTAQKRAFDIFHFALLPHAYLFLSTSESADDASELFTATDKKHRLYCSRPAARASLPLPLGTSALARVIERHVNGETPSRSPERETISALEAPRLTNQDRSPWSDLHLKLVERFGPPSLIVNGDHDILHLSEAAAPFLQFVGGEPNLNLFRVVHPMLRVALRAALFRATQTGKASAVFAVPMDREDGQRLVDIRVAPALELAPGLAFVTFESRASSALPIQPQDEPSAQLERELDHMKRYLREVVDQQEASTEELQAGNEELQAMNEELRSATEELETSREELESINEELTTVNQELKIKVDELSSSNSHLHNLMGSTAIATLFLDRDFRIMRFTPSAVDLFSLIPGDVGRPLSNLRHRLTYPDLLSDAARVLEHLVPVEREVAEANGAFFLARILPYRTIEDRIAGVVLTFVDVTELHLAQDDLRMAQQELEGRVQERTAQLDAVNDALRAENIMHERAEKARQELQVRLVDAQEHERSRISRELHDEVGQQITALMLALKSLESELPSGNAPAKFRELRGIAEEVGREIHQLASQLRPVALDELGLSRALSGYLDAWTIRSGISVDFFSDGLDEERVSSVVETTLYRVVQEAMNNVYKHAAAKSVSVSVERRSDHVLAIIEDNGSGFDTNSLQSHSNPERMGILGMTERTSMVGGAFTLESRAGVGTTVRVRIPLPVV